MMQERSVAVYYTTILRWMQRYAPEIESGSLVQGYNSPVLAGR